MPSRSRHAGAGAVLLTFAGLIGAAGCSGPRESATPPPASMSTPAPPPASYVLEASIAPDLPLLHANINNGARPAEITRAVYEFAARHPEVLKYVPCFCGCERGGHKDNDDCFVGARDQRGKVTEWETHGLVCEVCIDVAQQAMQMHNSGASPTAIRAAIEKRFSNATNHTPTPMPPKGSKGH